MVCLDGAVPQADPEGIPARFPARFFLAEKEFFIRKAIGWVPATVRRPPLPRSPWPNGWMGWARSRGRPSRPMREEGRLLGPGQRGELACRRFTRSWPATHQTRATAKAAQALLYLVPFGVKI